MSEVQELIPPPAIVREKLSQNIREARLLRAILRVSVLAAEERHREKQPVREMATAQ